MTIFDIKNKKITNLTGSLSQKPKIVELKSNWNQNWRKIQKKLIWKFTRPVKQYCFVKRGKQFVLKNSLCKTEFEFLVSLLLPENFKWIQN